MRQSILNGIVAGLIGAVLTVFGSAGLYHRSIMPGLVMSVAGLFLIFSASEHFGFRIKNPVAQRFARASTVLAFVASSLIVLAAAIARSVPVGRWAFARVIGNAQEHFWTSIFVLGLFAWLMISRPSKERTKL